MENDNIIINTQKMIKESISKIKRGGINPSILSKENQNLIIEYLRYEENMTINKIAKILKLNKDTVSSRLKKIEEAQLARLIARGFDPWRVIHEVERVKRIIQTKAALN